MPTPIERGDTVTAARRLTTRDGTTIEQNTGGIVLAVLTSGMYRVKFRPMKSDAVALRCDVYRHEVQAI